MLAKRQLQRYSSTLRTQLLCMGCRFHKKLFLNNGSSAVIIQRNSVTDHVGESAGTSQGNVGTAKGTISGEESALVKHLRSELENSNKRLDRATDIIHHLVKLIDKERFAAEMAMFEKSIEGGGGLFVTETSSELEAALQTPGARIVLLENHHYVLGTLGSVNITKTNVTIIGNNATIEGYLKVSRDASLEARNVTFLAPKGFSGECEKGPRNWRSTTLLPCLDVNQRSNVYLRNCKLLGGRDGLYLGVESYAKLENVLIADCYRGLYEGVRCRVSLLGCKFQGNFFHIVLLGHDREERAKVFSESSGDPNTVSSETSDLPVCFSDTSENGEKITRADIVLDHDPIEDVYAVFIHKGRHVELPANLATCNLSDPVY
ncbi:hypothetical protein LSM04_003323 [Trypanosoma melophagium]|uniref:uncharacterized protein n=1 Tax=Trypanosoma melophagium TaxID=715481 RepID=UPI00351A15FF|nr:hypothetical protein LSM04_003323 [Trypanosoma melophagium]